MPIMPDGTFWNIDEVKGTMHFAANVAAEMRKVLAGNDTTQAVMDKIAELDAEAEMLRGVVAEYERRVAG